MEYMAIAIRPHHSMPCLSTPIETHDNASPLRLAEVIGDKSFPLVTEVCPYDNPRPHHEAANSLGIRPTGISLIASWTTELTGPPHRAAESDAFTPSATSMALTMVSASL